MKHTNPKSILILSCSILFFLGISNSAIGPILPELAKNAQVDLAYMGAVYTAFFTGSILAQVFLGTIMDRFGQRPVLMAGILLMAAGLGAYNFILSYPALLGFSFLGGLGLGAIVLGNSVLIANTFPDRSVSALNLINFFYGVGAIVGPAIVGLVISQWGLARWVVGLDSLAYLALSPFILKLNTVPKSPASQAALNGPKSSLFTPLLWTLGIMTLLYVGLETGLGGWITTYVNQTTRLSLETSALVTSGFWFSYTLGRLLNSWLGMRLSPERILILNLSGAGLGSVLFSIGIGNQWPTIFSILILGFTFGPIYPTLIAVTNASHPKNPGQSVGIVSSMGSAGGMMIPLLQGYLILNIGAFCNPLLSLTIICLILFLMIISVKSIRKTRQTAAN